MGVSPFDQAEDAVDESANKLQALLDLERNSAAAVAKQERSSRVAGSIKTLIRPANSSARNQSPPRQTVCQDISHSGCRVVSTAPMLVGDVYYLQFDRNAVKLPGVFARCVRCRLLRDDAFECAFTFFTALAIPGQQEPGPLELGS